jgi:ferredoxin-NADP reductase
MGVQDFETRVTAVIRRTRDIKSFRFAAPGELSFLPGQYLVLTIKIGGVDAVKHFSISISPTERAGYVEFTKRITGSEFSQALDRLQVGDWARIQLPFGFFTFTGEHERIAFLVGGIGITAVRSICRNACDAGLPTDIVLVYANRAEEDIAFHDDFVEMAARNPKLRVVYTLDAPRDPAAWRGRTGFISGALVREELPDFAGRFFYLCGPPRMVDAMRGMLADELKIGPRQIIWEHFLGYA